MSTVDRPFLSARWRYLAILNYEVDPGLLAKSIPAGTELDCWGDAAIVSLVGFRFTHVRVLGVSIPGHRQFDEVNLRFYVRRRLDSGEWRRGVVFIKEIVPKWVIARVARFWYGEPYVRRPMRHDVQVAGADAGRPARVEYTWRRRARWISLAVRTVGPPAAFAPGSEAEFITEHYWGYTAHRNWRTTEYEVRHPPWRVWRVSRADVEGNLASEYGPVFGAALTGPPRSAFLAEGSHVTVFRGHDLDLSGISGAAA